MPRFNQNFFKNTPILTPEMLKNTDMGHLIIPPLAILMLRLVEVHYNASEAA
ncbi:MAG: hypothetical protein ACYTF1_17255 [Planctomycetota bacterium]|jgi:hypothetical protein